MKRNPEGLIWIAEALGVDPDLSQLVVDEALVISPCSRTGGERDGGNAEECKYGGDNVSASGLNS